MEIGNEAFYADFWRFMKRNKNIEFDQNGLSTDEYWERLDKDARDFAEKKYPTAYARNMVLSFMKEMERRARILEVQYRILIQQEQSFEKGSPEFSFYGKFVNNLSKKYNDPPVLLPDESNKDEVDAFWENVYTEAKALYQEYGEFTKEILTNYINELQEKAEEKKRQGVDGQQMDFSDAGYEDLAFG